MANNEDDIKIVFGAEADESSAEQTGKKLRKSVEKGFGDDSRIKVPVDITVPIDNTKKKLTEAQKDITSEISKMMAKGFSASGKDIDNLTSKFNTFTKALDAAGKGRQNKIFREIRRQVEELQKSYKALKTETNSAKSYTPKATNTKKSTRQTARDRYLDQQEQYSKRAQGAGERVELKKELDEVRKNKSNIPSSGNIKESMVNEHEMRLSRYSSYGSNWARDLAKTLKIEEAKAAKTLKKWFDKDYEVGTEVGEKSGKIVSKKTGRSTTEAQMITDVYNNVKQSLTDSVRKSEAGDETVTADTFTELAAIMKILNTTLMTKLSGKSLEEATSKTATDIANAISRPYSISEKDAIGFTDLTEGREKGIGPGHENTQKELKEFQKRLESWGSNLYENVSSSVNQLTETLSTIRASDSYRNELNRLNDTMETTFSAINDVTAQTANVNRSVKIGNTKEAVEDDAAEKISKEHRDIDRDTARTVKQDAVTGFNTDSKADELITLVRSILQQIQGIAPKNKKSEDIEKSQKDTEENVQEIAKDKTPSATSEAQAKNLKDYSMEMQKAWDTYEQSIDPLRAQMALTPVAGTFKNYYEGTDVVQQQRRAKELEKEREKQLKEASISHSVEKSTIYASPFRQGFFNAVEDAFRSLTGTTKKYEEVLKANADEQDAMAAERIKTYGLNNGRNPNDTGDIAGMRRILQLYRTNKASIEQNPELMQKIKLTPGRDVDTTELTKALNKALSGRQMQNAQNGGGFWKNFLGFATGGLGYAFMPSLEKSRAQADGLNQMMGNINKALQSVLINIQTKETELSGMEKSGEAKFDKDGYLTSDSSSAAFKTLADLEEEKLVLDSIKADLLANDEIIKKTGGRFSQIVKHLNFTSPVLKENNGILRNINSGLDKNGKALKFQTRLAEILNYTYQLMSRSIGQAFKNLLSMINPINLVRKMFQDFGSYDVKWQRTMNVIKNNFREIIKPFMEWIAQQLVNIIGFFDIISMKIQEAFGYTPISLFDQKNANDFKKTYEEIQNVTAGFDELHDIGSSSENDPDNLLGEIYKPQLSQEWIDLANKIGDLFAGIIKGDLGFGEVMKTILSLLGETLALIGKAIWDWFKETAIGKWIIEHWKGLLATLLALFIGWQLLKIFGPTLLGVIGNAFKSLGSLIWTGLSTVGNKLLDALCGTQFGSDMVRGFKAMFNSGGMIGTFKAGGATLGTIFAQALTAVAGVAIATGSIATGFDMIADDTSYNMGLMANGGNEEDKKSGAGGAAVSILGGAAGGALTGLAIGGPIGAAIGAGIGAIAGAISSILAPAIEDATVKAKEMNNEMQKIEYYEGAVQGASTQVSNFSELLDLSNQALQTQTDKVYALGEKYGVSTTYLDSLVQAMKDGNYTSEMAVGLNSELSGALDQLDWHYQNNAGLTDKLTEAKRKLQKAEMDLAIAQDVEAGNFELAAARVEVAYASNVYTVDEATKKMTQLIKEGSADQRSEILQNMSPELRENWNDYYTTTEEGFEELAGVYDELKESEREALLQDLDPELDKKLAERNQIIKKRVDEANGFLRFLDIGNDGKIFGISYIGHDIPGYAVGTNYVPNDGLAYLHQGEAVIPKKYNQPYQPNSTDQAYIGQMIDTMRALDATIQQGIEIRGEFKQRGTDLVATVKKVENRNGNQPLNNAVFAR